MLSMLKHTLFLCVYAKGVFSIHKITSMQEAQAPKLGRFSNTAAALANLCISVHYGKLNLMLPSASKLQKITFILMKCRKKCCHQSCSFWPKYAPNRLSAGASPQTPLGELKVLPQTP